MRLTPVFVLSLAAWFATFPAVAQDRVLAFTPGTGIEVQPSYPGSDSSEARADFALRFQTFNLGDTGFSLGGAFRVVGSRDALDDPELVGLDEIDTAYELGIGLTYRQPGWQAFGKVRQGFGGHDGITGTIGADMIFRPSNRVTITAGPRLNLGDGDYASTYFGVSAEEAAVSGFDAFDAGGGLLGAAFEVQGTYEINDDWAVEGLLSYERLQNSAADSPITQGGSDEQWRMSIGVSRAFNLRF